MTPLVSLLRFYRNERGITSKAFAAELGVSEKKLSAIETGRHPSFDDKSIELACKFLRLTENESAALHEAALVSSRDIHIPLGTSPQEYRLFHKLMKSLGSLSNFQINEIRRALDNSQGRVS